MNSKTAVRRFALGATIAGAAIGAVPAMASADSSCLYNTSTKVLSVEEQSNTGLLNVLRSNDNIAIRDFNGPVKVCTNQVDFFTVAATVFNTDRIDVSSKDTANAKQFTFEQLGPGATPESDGVSEIETYVTTNNRHVDVKVNGTTGPDAFRIGRDGINFGRDLLATDNDVDIVWTARSPEHITIDGREGDDQISGRGNFFNPLPTSVPLVLQGGPGNDFLEGGLGRDNLMGGIDNDRLFSDDGVVDTVSGGPNFDTITRDAGDKPVNNDIEQTTIAPVGRLQLAPHALRASTGKTSRLSMSWTHPKAWRELRAVMLRLYDGAKAVGMINIRPSGGRLTADGAVTLAGGSRVSHHGKTVTARLAFRLPRSLAGHHLRVAVQATDRHGRKQLESHAGTIQVGR